MGECGEPEGYSSSSSESLICTAICPSLLTRSLTVYRAPSPRALVATPVTPVLESANLEDEMSTEEKVYQAVLGGHLKIDSQGRIWKVVSGERVRAESQCGEYLSINGAGGKTGAHRLVVHHFHGPIPLGFEVNHENGIGSDNRPENLEAVTRTENVRHARDVLGREFGTSKPGGILLGELNPQSKLTDIQRQEIVQRFKSGEPHHGIAADYPVLVEQVRRIGRK